MPAKPPAASQQILPLLPLRGMLVFPHMVTSLEVGRERSLLALEAAMMSDERHIVLAAQKQAQVDDPAPDDIFAVGTLVEIKQLLKLPEDRVRVLVSGICRVKIFDYVQEQPYHAVGINVVDESAGSTAGVTAEVKALMRTAITELDKYIKLSKKGNVETAPTINDVADPGMLADMVAAQLTVAIEERQLLLEIAAPAERLERICGILVRETEILELEKRIQARVRKQMEKAQREYYLREQMKAIQKELGERDERAAEVEEYRAKIADAKLPKEANEKVLHELGRLERMPPMAAEAVVVRNYLDWVLELPWNKSTKDRLDVNKAEKVLEAEHYGLETVKERILEFLAVRQLAKKIKGTILCLVGPPGVGKTSLAHSVADALGRRFYRFSLGGVRDEAEIRGHRRTYVGAMPGKILQAMRAAGSRNPVILLDEVDKMSSDFRGDPSSALLEVLDPEQNANFGDHYLEIPFDLSDVMFITTANVLYAIPRPLRDRMEIIQIPGYTEEEKLQIALRHLLPKQTQQHGLKPEQLLMGEKVLRELITGYTREAGVRSLERTLASICRKAAKEIVSEKKARVRVTRRSLVRYLGQPRFHYNRAEDADRVGVATGLAYTEVGGDILNIEVTVIKGRGRLTLTGKLGEVMRESAQAAYSYIRSRSTELGIEPDISEKYDIHVHVPEGAVPKDGPSAGITIAVALASALSRRPVKRDWAMTGEITLRGRVLPIGGVKEKVLAAHRSGVTHVILPQENEPDLDDVPANVRRHLDFVLVDHIDKVFEHVLAEAPIAEPALTLPGMETEAPVTSVKSPETGLPGQNSGDWDNPPLPPT